MKPVHLSWAERLSVHITEFLASWLFFGLVNLVVGSYAIWQDMSAHPFDAYPFTFLNLMLAVFTFDMEILIMVAAKVAQSQADRQSAYTLELAQTTVSVLHTLRDMVEADVERDQKRDRMLELLRESGANQSEVLAGMSKAENAQTAMIESLRESDKRQSDMIERMCPPKVATESSAEAAVPPAADAFPLA